VGGVNFAIFLFKLFAWGLILQKL